MKEQPGPDLAIPDPGPYPPREPWWRRQPHRFLTSMMDLYFQPRAPVSYAAPTRRWKVAVALVVALLFGPLLWATTATLALQRGGPTSPVAGIDLRTNFGNTLTTVLLQAALLFFAVGVAFVVLRLSGDRLLNLGLRPGPAAVLASDSGFTLTALYLPALLLGGVAGVGVRLVFGGLPDTTEVTGGDTGQLIRAIVIALLLAIPTAVAEEVVALGLAYRLLERLGWPVWLIALALVGLRASYHIYYGISVISLLGWAYVSVLFYRRYRRLWPLIIAHAAYDTMSITTALAGSTAVAVMVVLGYLLLPLPALGALLTRLRTRWGLPWPSTRIVPPAARWKSGRTTETVAQ
jgi:membrane protease YdiL (CAAX protease family)